MLRLRICVMIFMVLIGTILSEDEHAKLYHYHDILRAHTSWTGRFGFNYFNELRKQFCHSFCKPADIDYMSYIANLMCAAKCPEMYLPHSTSTQSTESTTTNITMTTMMASPNTNSQNPQQNQSSTSMLPSSATVNTTPSQNPQQNQSSTPSSITTVSSSTPGNTTSQNPTT